jgi:hypothetical protein
LRAASRGQAALKLDHALLPLAMLGHAGEIVPLHSAPFSPFISIMRIAILHGHAFPDSLLPRRIKALSACRFDKQRGGDQRAESESESESESEQFKIAIDILVKLNAMRDPKKRDRHQCCAVPEILFDAVPFKDLENAAYLLIDLRRETEDRAADADGERKTKVKGQEALPDPTA